MSEQFPNSQSPNEGLVESQLKQDNPKLFAYLVNKVKESTEQMKGGKTVSDQHIMRMANSIALQEERRGAAMSEEHIDDLFRESVIDEQVDRLVPKLEGPNKLHLSDASGVIGSADTKKGIMDKAEEERRADTQ